MKRRHALALTVAAGSLIATGADAATPDEPGLMGASATLPAEAAATAAATTDLGPEHALDEPAPDDGSDEWDVAFTPYVWLAGIKGNIAIPRNDSEADVDKSFADILGDLKFAFMGTLDVEYRRFIVHTDLVFLSLGANVERVDSLVFTEGEVDAKTLLATAAIGYRVVDQGPMYVDLYAGGRLVSLDVDLSLTGPLQTRKASASPSNVSPLIGGKARFPLGERWGLALQGDIGFDSDVKWQLAGTVQYQLGDHWRMGAGYRHLQLHHDKEDAEFDIAFSGPIVAFTYIF
jgi:opacity protein-like surface antigen